MKKIKWILFTAAVIATYTTVSAAGITVRPLHFPRDHAGHMGEFSDLPEIFEVRFIAGDAVSVDGKRLAFNVAMFDYRYDTIVNRWALFSATNVDDAQYNVMPPTGFSESEVSISERRLDMNFGDQFILQENRGYCRRGFRLSASGQTMEGTPFSVNVCMSTRHQAPFLHGDPPGYVPMGEGTEAMYYSYPKMPTDGYIAIGDDVFWLDARRSRTWFDHEWGTFYPGRYSGHSVFSVRLDNGLDAMVWINSVRPEETDIPLLPVGGFASFRMPCGKVVFKMLDEDLMWDQNRYWQVYPVENTLTFSDLGLTMDIEASFDEQSLFGGYEGVASVDATYLGKDVSGWAHMLLTEQSE